MITPLFFDHHQVIGRGVHHPCSGIWIVFPGALGAVPWPLPDEVSTLVPQNGHMAQEKGYIYIYSDRFIVHSVGQGRLDRFRHFEGLEFLLLCDQSDELPLPHLTSLSISPMTGRSSL